MTHATLVRAPNAAAEESRALPSRRHRAAGRRRTRSFTRSDARRTVAGLESAEGGRRVAGRAAALRSTRRLRTSNPNVYAVGDVTGEYMLVHVAIYQGEVAARNACLERRRAAEYHLIGAHTVFTDPQFAAVGSSEKELRRKGHRLRHAAVTILPSTAKRSAWGRPKASSR